MLRPAFRPGAGLRTLLALFAAGGLVACQSETPQEGAITPGLTALVAAKAPSPTPADCRRRATCQPAPCRIGWVTACEKGQPVCTELGWLPNGASCGDQAVCYQGECQACAAGEVCQARDEWGNELTCQVGTIECSTGQPLCQGAAPAPNGFKCWGSEDYVCRDGACNWCVDGVTPCTPSDNTCHSGLYESCHTTGGTCVDTGVDLADGNWCPADGYCSGGECKDCGWNKDCTPAYGSCWTGFMSCATGARVCQPSSMFWDGYPCDDGGTCSYGACVTGFRNVSGAALTTFWPDVGPGEPFRAVPVDLLAAYREHPWGLQYFSVLTGLDGSFEVSGVPTAPLMLLVQTPSGPYAFETTADVVDLGVDVLGRADVVNATLPTPVTFDVDGLEAVASPAVFFTSSNAGVAASVPVPGPIDWSLAGRPLVEGTKGDVVGLLESVAAPDPAIPANVTAVRRCLPDAITDLTMVDGAAATVDATLGACAGSGSLSADWRIAAFTAWLPQIHPDATDGSSRLAVFMRPHQSAFAPGFRTGNLAGINGIPLLRVQTPETAVDLTVSGVQYGLQLPPSWSLYRHDRTRFGIPFLAPGATYSGTLGVNIGVDVGIASAPAVVEPVISPPRNLRIAGQDAWTSGLSWVGYNPIVTWDPPELVPAGVTPIYDLALFRLDVNPSGGTSFARVLEGRTTSTSLWLTTGLEWGSRYVLTVTATVTNDSLNAPLRRSVEGAYASVVSREFAPYY